MIDQIMDIFQENMPEICHVIVCKRNAPLKPQLIKNWCPKRSIPYCEVID